VQLQIGGKFGRASEEPGDAIVEVVRSADGFVFASVPLMVRVRKNANDLTPDERNRFLSALGRLNDQGLGRFLEFREMHNANVEDEAHGFSGFLPWHRAYLLDLERELQAIDSSVSLPYWRFDQAAPRLFTPDFIGVSNTSGTVSFSPGHALTFWRTDGVTGISRRPFFNTATERAHSPPWGEAIVDENTVLRNRPNFLDFARPRAVLERNPHGYAHTSFEGFIDTPETAPRDPLFFLLHTNVDRLWAKWQWLEGRFDVGLGAAAYVASSRIGHRLNDTMWPWNGVSVPPRPTTPAPGGGFAASPIVPVPGQQPRVAQMFDYQGIVAASNRLGFDYDDVPWQP
jgi:tyrosinase